MRTTTIKGLSHVAIVAKDLKSLFREILLSQPSIERQSCTDRSAMCITASIDMVYCQKFWMHFTTAYTLTSIGIKNLSTQFLFFDSTHFISSIKVFCIPFFVIREAFCTEMTGSRWTLTATSTYTIWNIATIFTNLFSIISLEAYLFIDRFLKSSLICLLMHIGVTSKCLFTFNLAARLTDASKTIKSSFIGAKVLRDAIFEFLAFAAAFLRNRGVHILNRLSFSALFLFVARTQGYVFSGGVITPSLGNTYLLYHSFAPPEKRKVGV
jgi:hypothetical protein